MDSGVAVVQKAMELIFYGAMTMFAVTATIFITAFLMRRR